MYGHFDLKAASWGMLQAGNYTDTTRKYGIAVPHRNVANIRNITCVDGSEPGSDCSNNSGTDSMWFRTR